MSDTEDRKDLSSGQNRRTIVKGAAWSVPVIAAAIAAPFAAASGTPTGTLTVATMNCTGASISTNPGFTLTAVNGDTAATTFIITSTAVLSASLRNAWTTSLGLNVTLLGGNSWQFEVPALAAGQTITFQSNTQLLNLLATFRGTVASSGSTAGIRITNLAVVKYCRTV